MNHPRPPPVSLSGTAPRWTTAGTCTLAARWTPPRRGGLEAGVSTAASCSSLACEEGLGSSKSKHKAISRFHQTHSSWNPPFGVFLATRYFVSAFACFDQVSSQQRRTRPSEPVFRVAWARCVGFGGETAMESLPKPPSIRPLRLLRGAWCSRPVRSQATSLLGFFKAPAALGRMEHGRPFLPMAAP